MFALNHLTFILIFTVVGSGFINGERYNNGSSEVESLPGIHAASHNEKAIDETTRNNTIGDVNDAHNDKHAIENKRMGQNLELPSNRTGIKFPPRFKHPSKMYTMNFKSVGTSIRLNCAANGNPTPNITWSKNDAPITRAYSQPSYRKWSILIDELTKTDEGNYTCLVCNELGCINHTVSVLVQERLYSKPILTRGPVNQTKLVGETAIFSCEFLSDMYPSIYWIYYKKYEYIFNHNVTAESGDVNDNRRIMTDDNINGPPEILTIYNVTKEDQGWYACVAMNTLGKAFAIGYLTVLDQRSSSRPSIEDGYPGNKTAFVHNTVRLTCPISSALEHFLYWLKPAKNYIGNGHVGSEEPIPEGLVIQSDDDTDKPEVLTLYNVTKEEGGWYVCVALNTLGRAFAKGYLTVLDRNNQHNEA